MDQIISPLHQLIQFYFNNNTILNATGGVQESDNTTFTGNNIFSGNIEFQAEVGIDEDDGASLEFNLTNGALPPQKCTTNLVSVQQLSCLLLFAIALVYLSG